jgi:tRNA-2-methylthio-N6-dimethylallyladenosine synthase
MAYIFKYSVRTGTPAASMPDQVPEKVLEERNQALLEVLREGSSRRSQALVGTVQEVLVEGPDKTGLRLAGRTPGNRTVVFDGPRRLVGTLASIAISRASVSTLYGDVAEGAGLPSSAVAASL